MKESPVDPPKCPRLRMIPPRYTRDEAEKILARLPPPNLRKIGPKEIQETLRWMKKDRAVD